MADTLQTVAANRKIDRADIDAAKAKITELRNALIRANQRIDELAAAGSSGSFVQEGVGAVVRTSQDKERERLAINDFLPTGAADDWRTALVDALAESANTNGATIWLPRHSARDIDNTGLGPPIWGSSSVWLEGDGATPATIRNVSTDGTDLINFVSSPGSLSRLGFRKLKIDSLATAGHIFAYALPPGAPDLEPGGLAYTRFEHLWVIQRNTTKSIMYSRVADDPGIGGGGHFENQWMNVVLEHGEGSDPAGALSNVKPPTVPAFDLEATVSLIVLNKWHYWRANSHGGLVPFWRIACTDDAPGNKKYVHQSEWRGGNVELGRRGIIRLEGHASGIIDDITYYDLGLNGNNRTAGIDGHLIEIVSGPSTLGNGGRASQHTRISGVYRNGAGHLLGVAETIIAVTSLSQSGGVATCTTDVAHGYATGDLVSIDGVTNADDYSTASGYKSITVTGANTFTYPVPGGTVSPATGVLTVSRVGRVVTSLMQTAGVATLTRTAHGFAVGQRIYIAGATQTDYNGRQTVLSVPTADTLTYAVPSATVSPATSTTAITVAEGAMDIKLGPSNEGDSIEHCNAIGGSDQMEVDVNGTNASVVGHQAGQATNGLTVYRAAPSIGAYTELGGASTTSRHVVNEVQTSKLSPTGAFLNWGFKGDLDGLESDRPTTTTVRILTGRCRSEDDASVCDSTSIITVNTASSGVNGIDTGTVAASTVYDEYLIWKAGSAPTPRGLAVVSGNAPVMPTDYVYRRRVAAFATDAAGLVIDFTMLGSGRFREVWYNAAETTLLFINGASDIVDTNKSVNKFVPVAARNAIILPRFTGSVAGAKMFLKPGLFTTADWSILTCQVAGQEVRGTPLRMPSSTGRNFSFKVSNPADVASAHCLGFEMFL